MKKTISINISGIFFHIDENAYQTLEEYLNTIRRHYEGTEGKEEILGDIETRIAEIFQTKINEKKQVIQQEDVDEVITILGKPEDIFGEAATESGNGNGHKSGHRRRRLYRDTDNRVLGGVCSGIGQYFNVDPIWFRIAFLIALFVFGSSVLIYLVLWIIIPPAHTTAEKLEMRGERINIKNIERNIREEFEELKKKYKDTKKWRRPRSREELRNFKRRMRDLKAEMRSRRYRPVVEQGNVVQRIGGVFENLIYYFVKTILMIIGISLLALGIAITIGFIISLTGSENYFMISQWGFHTLSLPAFTSLIFDTPAQANLAIAGLILLLGVPILMMIIGGIRLVFGLRERIRVLSITATCLWLIGLFLTIYSGFVVYRSFRVKGITRQEIPITPHERDVLYLDVPPGSIDPEEEADSKNTIVLNNLYFVSDEETTRNFGYPSLKIVPGDNSGYRLLISRIARGKTTPLARKRSENITYNVYQADSVLWLGNYFSIPDDEQWRNQKVRMTLKVPPGKVVFLTLGMENLVCDSDEIDDTWSEDMIGKKMVMTETGLKPL